MKKFMFVNRKAPYGTIYALESLEVVLIAATLDDGNCGMATLRVGEAGALGPRDPGRERALQRRLFVRRRAVGPRRGVVDREHAVARERDREDDLRRLAGGRLREIDRNGRRGGFRYQKARGEEGLMEGPFREEAVHARRLALNLDSGFHHEHD